MPEARLIRGTSGLVPDGDGWFVVNVNEAEAIASGRFGAGVRFEGSAGFPGLGFNVRELHPGQPCAMYHSESAAEAFLVLSGECVLVVEGEERPMRKGDFAYTPPGTAHVIVGAGNGPCWIVMAGARPEGWEVDYPVSEAAARYDASVTEETADPRRAYADSGPLESTTLKRAW